MTTNKHKTPKRNSALSIPEKKSSVKKTKEATQSNLKGAFEVSNNVTAKPSPVKKESSSSLSSTAARKKGDPTSPKKKKKKKQKEDEGDRSKEGQSDENEGLQSDSQAPSKSQREREEKLKAQSNETDDEEDDMGENSPEMNEVWRMLYTNKVKHDPMWLKACPPEWLFAREQFHNEFIREHLVSKKKGNVKATLSGILTEKYASKRSSYQSGKEFLDKYGFDIGQTTATTEDEGFLSTRDITVFLALMESDTTVPFTPDAFKKVKVQDESITTDSYMMFLLHNLARPRSTINQYVSHWIYETDGKNIAVNGGVLSSSSKTKTQRKSSLCAKAKIELTAEKRKRDGEEEEEEEEDGNKSKDDVSVIPKKKKHSNKRAKSSMHHDTDDDEDPLNGFSFAKPPDPQVTQQRITELEDKVRDLERTTKKVNRALATIIDGLKATGILK